MNLLNKKTLLILSIVAGIILLILFALNLLTEEAPQINGGIHDEESIDEAEELNRKIQELHPLVAFLPYAEEHEEGVFEIFWTLENQESLIVSYLIIARPVGVEGSGARQQNADILVQKAINWISSKNINVDELDIKTDIRQPR